MVILPFPHAQSGRSLLRGIIQALWQMHPELEKNTEVCLVLCARLSSAWATFKEFSVHGPLWLAWRALRSWVIPVTWLFLEDCNGRHMEAPTSCSEPIEPCVNYPLVIRCVMHSYLNCPEDQEPLYIEICILVFWSQAGRWVSGLKNWRTRRRNDLSKQFCRSKSELGLHK